MNPVDEKKFIEAKTAELKAVIQEFLTGTEFGRRFRNTPEAWKRVYDLMTDAATLSDISIPPLSLSRCPEF